MYTFIDFQLLHIFSHGIIVDKSLRIANCLGCYTIHVKGVLCNSQMGGGGGGQLCKAINYHKKTHKKNKQQKKPNYYYENFPKVLLLD